MADIQGTLEQLSALALDAARAKGARVSLRLNAWPVEIPITDAAALDGGGSAPGVIQGQVIVRDGRGAIITTLGPDVQTNYLLTGAIVAGLAGLLFVIVRGLTPRKKG